MRTKLQMYDELILGTFGNTWPVYKIDDAPENLRKVGLRYAGTPGLKLPHYCTTLSTIQDAFSLALEWLEDERCCVTRGPLKDRINRGWTPERAMTTATRKVGICKTKVVQ